MVIVVTLDFLEMGRYYDNYKYFYIKRNGVVVILPLRTQVLKILWLMRLSARSVTEQHLIRHRALPDTNQMWMWGLWEVTSHLLVREQGWQDGRKAPPKTSATATAPCVITSLHHAVKPSCWEQTPLSLHCPRDLTSLYREGSWDRWPLGMQLLSQLQRTCHISGLGPSSGTLSSNWECSTCKQELITLKWNIGHWERQGTRAA